MNIPCTAILSASSCLPSPNALESSALVPTPTPPATPIIRFCIGNAIETAVSASSLILATNILSTILYSACTSIDIIIGRAILISSLLTGIVPILFSFIVLLIKFFSLILLVKIFVFFHIIFGFILLINSIAKPL